MTSDIWWTESVNFLLFRSDRGIEHNAAEVAVSIDPAIDLALLAKGSSPEARAIGAVEDALLFELMPYAQPFQPPPAQPSEPPAPAA